MRQSNLLLSIVLLLLPIVSISAQSLILRQAESDAASEQKTILLEKFTGEWCGNCPTSEPKIHDFMTKAEAEGYKVSLIEYHYNDFLQQDSRIESLISSFNVDAYPALVFNRTFNEASSSIYFNPNRANLFDPVYEAVKGMKEEVRIDKIEQFLGEPTDGTTKPAKFRIFGHISGEALSTGIGDLFLTVVVTEDNIPESKRLPGKGGQMGAPKGYIHQAVARKILTEAEGHRLEVKADGTFFVELTNFFMKNWKYDQCKVIAFVHKSISVDDHKWSRVHTVFEVPFNQELANESILAPESAAHIISVDNGLLHIHGDYVAMQIFDISGSLVATDCDTPLLSGSYIVSLNDGITTYTYKVVVH